MARPAAPVVLSDDEREILQRLARRPKTAQRRALRARIVLACAAGRAIGAVAEDLGVTPATVSKWRGRYAREGLDGLDDEPRPGAPRKITDEKVEEVVVATLETSPTNATHWSPRLMAEHAGIDRTTVGEIWRAFRLNPRRTETFVLSPDPYLVEKVRDVVGLYLNPPEHAIVLCVDEKSQIQALDRTQPVFPLRPGVPERQTHDYRRHGTTSLFAALNVATGEVMGKCFRRHRANEFKMFLQLIDEQVPAEYAVHLVLDNYATHKTPAIQRWLAAHPRFHLHFTPTRGCWLNQVERWFALLSERGIRRSTHRSVRQLEQAIYDWMAGYNDDPKPFKWVKTADQILARIRRFCERALREHGVMQRTSVTGH